MFSLPQSICSEIRNRQAISRYGFHIKHSSKRNDPKSNEIFSQLFSVLMREGFFFKSALPVEGVRITVVIYAVPDLVKQSAI